jgi:hypothetical protein
MLQFSTRVAAVIVLAAATALSTGTVLSGDVSADQGKDRCSLNTLKATYVFAAHGVLNDGQAALPYAEAGTWTLDGKGGATGVFSASLNGETIESLSAFSATYQHKSGCVFTALAPLGTELLEFHLYTTDQGATITYFTAGVSGVMYRR